jgi:hypothetical protein
MRLAVTCAVAVSACLLASAASAEVSLTIQDGRVTLVAKDATLRQILAEWARVGQTRIVNGERVPGGPITLQLTNVPEEQALETLLRPISGFVASPRPDEAANLSRFDKILVMPTPVAPPQAAPTTATTAPAVYPQPAVPSPQPRVTAAQGVPPTQPQSVPDDPEDDRPTPASQRSPVFNAFPQPQAVPPVPQSAPNLAPGVVPPPAHGAARQQPNAPAPTTYSSTPTVPYGGVSVPGTVAPPPPQQPGQQPNNVPPKRPGG